MQRTNESEKQSYPLYGPAPSFRGEAGNDIFEAQPDVTLPLWLYGGNGNNTLIGGAGNNVIVAAAARTPSRAATESIRPRPSTTATRRQPSRAWRTTSKPPAPGAWSSPTEVAGAFNDEELSHLASTGGDTAD